MTTKDEVKALWKLCFDDSDKFIDLYFNVRYKEEFNMAVRQDGKIISALQMIPYPMTYCGSTISTSYISGACTHPDYRKHGAMHRLLQETHRRMYEDGVLLSTLIPAEEWLVDYYGKSGYTLSFGIAVEKVATDSLHPSDSYEVNEESNVSAAVGSSSLVEEHFHYFDVRARSRECYVQHLREDFLIVMADLRLAGGKLLVARKEGRIMGMAFCVMEKDGLCIRELLADDEAAKDTLLSAAAHIYNVHKVLLLVPSSSARNMGMARVIHVEKMLTLFAKKYPEAKLFIQLYRDEALPENNGYYTVEGGVCSRERKVGEKYCLFDIGRFTRLLLEAEHPYMSLMLN